MADRGVVSRSPTLSLITRKFARQSHAVFSESRNAVFYRLRRSVRLGTIPIARSTLRLRRTTQDNSGKQNRSILSGTTTLDSDTVTIRGMGLNEPIELVKRLIRASHGTGSSLYRAGSGFTGTLVQRLACFEHLNELQQSSLAGLRFFCIVQSIENGIAVLAVERFEELSRNRTSRQCRL